MAHHYEEIELGKYYLNERNKCGKYIKERMSEEHFSKDVKKLEEKKTAFHRMISKNNLFKEVNRERRRKIENKKRSTAKNYVSVQWYELYSEINNFYGMMKSLGYEKYYRGIYGGLSFEVHALNSMMDMLVKNDEIYIKRIRNPEEGSTIFSLACIFSLSALRKIYEYLKDGEYEKEEFREFFIDFEQKKMIVCHNLDLIKT